MTAEVYEPAGAEGLEFCHPARQEDFETLNLMIDGTPRLGTWRSPPMRIVRDDEGEKLVESDSRSVRSRHVRRTPRRQQRWISSRRERSIARVWMR